MVIKLVSVSCDTFWCYVNWQWYVAIYSDVCYIICYALVYPKPLLYTSFGSYTTYYTAIFKVHSTFIAYTVTSD